MGLEVFCRGWNVPRSSSDCRRQTAQTDVLDQELEGSTPESQNKTLKSIH